MILYVSKAEHKMTEYLNMVIASVRKDINEKEEMKTIMQAVGSQYLMYVTANPRVL